MALSGYSGTPLVKKLGIKEGFDVLFVDTPVHYRELLADCPSINVLRSMLPDSADFIHLFCLEAISLESKCLSLKPILKKSGTFWVSWPKGSSKIKTDLSREYIRSVLLKIGLVDVKVCAIDADWSGLKFVYRLKDRK